MKLKTIEIQGFGLFPDKKQKYEFKDGETLIIGDNQDSQGSDSNGAGKTTFLTTIPYALFGETLNDISVNEIVNPSLSECTVSLQLEDKNNIHTIQRSRGQKENLIFSIENSKEIHNRTRRTATQTQEEILKEYNLNPKKYFLDFVNTTYFSSDTLKSFVGKATTNTERIQLLTRFLNLSKFDLATIYCKDIVKSLKATINLINEKIDSLKSNLPKEYKSYEEYDIAINSYIEELNASKQEWLSWKQTLLHTKEKLSKYELIEQQINNLNSQKELIEKKKKKLSETKQSLSKELTALESLQTCSKSDKFKDLEKTIEKFRKDKDEILNNISVLDIVIKQIRVQLEKPFVCPQCNSELSLIGNQLKPVNMTELKKLLSEKESSKLSFDKSKKQVDSDILSKNSLLQENNKILTDIKLVQKQTTYYESTIQDIENEIENRDFDEEIEALRKQLPSEMEDINDVEQQLSEAEKSLSGLDEEFGRSKEIKRNIITWSSELLLITAELEKENAKLYQYTFWNEHYPRIKQQIIESYLPIFESRINYYLTLVNTPFSCSLQAGEVSKDFSVLITDENGIERVFETYSKGERTRIGVCVGFALRDIAMTRNSLPFDFILIDEIVDGLDETGIGEFFKLIRTLPGQKLIISHNSSLKQMFSSVLCLTKKNGAIYLKAA